MKKCVHLIMTLAMSLVLTFGGTLSAVAAENDNADDGTKIDYEIVDLSKTGSIAVGIKDLESGKFLSDGEISIYQVAGLTSTDHGIVYRWMDDFESFGDAPEKDEDLDRELASKLADLVQQKNLTTDATKTLNGEIKFDNLELGLYLVVQTKASEGYNAISPFLVSVPTRNDETDASGNITGYSYEYDVNASPKSEAATKIVPPEEPEKPETPPANPPRTPDKKLPQTGQLWWPVVVLTVSGIILVGVGIRMKNRRKS